MSPHETPGRRKCHFESCDWGLDVTALDRVADTRRAYSLHLQRHAEALTPEDVYTASFNAIIKSCGLAL